MSNDPRPAKPPLPLLLRPQSGTLPSTQLGSRPSNEDVQRSAKETGRSGTIIAVRPQAAPRARRREPVLRRLDPGFTAEDEDRESWERAGTLLLRSPYRDTAATIPSPEELEARLVAELTDGAPIPAPGQPVSDKPGSGAHFEPAHAAAVTVSPIIELEKSAPVIDDPLEITGAPKARAVLELVLPTPASEAPPPISAEGTAQPTAFAAEPAGVPTDFEAHAADTTVPDATRDGELASEPSESSRSTVPAAWRRRSPGSRLRALLVVMVVLGGLGAAGWYRYPAQCERGWRLATTEVTVWQRALEYQWSIGMRALGR